MQIFFLLSFLFAASHAEQLHGGVLVDSFLNNEADLTEADGGVLFLRKYSCVAMNFVFRDRFLCAEAPADFSMTTQFSADAFELPGSDEMNLVQTTK